MEVAITKMSSKGQIVIPQEMRQGLKEGSKLLLVKSGRQIIMKTATQLERSLKEDIEFARRTEAAWKEFSKGKFKSMDSKDFMKELETW